MDNRLVERLLREAHGDRWRVPRDAFAGVLDRSLARAFPGGTPGAGEAERYLGSLHLEDLALACACAAGDERAWDHFVVTHRPVLYRAADALDPTGGARELADSLYADLFGVGVRDGELQSLFRYYHGRSSLATWLRAVLAQRHVDRLRSAKRTEPLPDEESPHALVSPNMSAESEAGRAGQVALVRDALARALADLAARDRFRLSCYYAQGLTLAETGRVLHEHEATVSRQLARTRRAIRESIEARLRADAGLGDEAITECLRSVAEDPGPLDLREFFGTKPGVDG